MERLGHQEAAELFRTLAEELDDRDEDKTESEVEESDAMDVSWEDRYMCSSSLGRCG